MLTRHMTWSIVSRLSLCLLLACNLFVAGCDDDEDDEPSLFTWEINADKHLEFFHDGRSLFTLTSIAKETFDPDVLIFLGFYEHSKLNPAEEALSLIQLSNGSFELEDNTRNKVGRLSLEPTEHDNFRVRVMLDDGVPANAIHLSFKLGATDRFWGFGEQYNYVDLRGQELSVWVTEQGIGRFENPAAIFQGSYTDTYFPMGYFLDPKAGRGFLLENPEYSAFDLGKSASDTWSVEVWNGREASFLLLPGPTGNEVIEQLTAEVGRPASNPPEWAYEGCWLAIQGGSDVVRDTVRIALDANVALSAVWCQDWVGVRNFAASDFGVQYHWIWDESLYPQLPELIDELESQGIRFFGYFNNFVMKHLEHWAEMEANGWLIETEAGEAYELQVPSGQGSMIDPTDPGAEAYFKSFARQATDLGIRGWMCDFGEWMPYDAVMDVGPGTSQHNRYPEEWHRINREALDEAYPDGDYVMFTRSGFTGDHKVAHVVWAGDQEATWEEGDGFSTVVKAGLTLGMSGIPYFTHDVGGFSGGPRSEELQLRWTELGAFTPFMRTHEGLKRFENVQFDSNQTLLEHFAKFTRLHRIFAPYFHELGENALETGLPIIRHTALVDPEWDPAYDAHWQWMLGEQMVFAPVVEESATTVQVYLPQGAWRHVPTDDRYAGRRSYTIDAPIGTPALFVREGKLDSMALAALKEFQ